MKFISKQFFFIFLILFFITNSLFAQRTMNIRLASPVPENTAWGQVINRMAAEWRRVTNGQINVTVIHGGTAGTEAQVLALLRSNQVQAGIFTSMGLNSVVKEVMALSYPFLIRNDNELKEVLRRLRPDIDALFQTRGFVTLTWAHAGWIKLFTRTPVITPDDMRKLKVASSPDEQDLIQAFRIMQYNIVPASLNELLMSLQSGRVDATYISPIYAASGQLFGIAGNMSTVNVAPFMGAVLMNDVTWKRIPENFKPALMEACRKAQAEIEASLASLEIEAVNTMVKHGLKIVDLTPEQMQVWFDDTDKYENRLIGGANPLFNREYYNRVSSILTEFRRTR